MTTIARVTTSHLAPSPPPWWQAAGALRRFLADLIEGELSRLRHATVALPAAHGGPTDLVAHLGADSLELMALSAALAEALQLNRAGLLDGLLADTRFDSWVAQTAVALDADAGAAADPAAARRLCFRTSGSAGSPKPCVHELANLWQEVAALAPLLPGRRRIVSAVPAHHIYGFLFTVLLPQHAGASAAPLSPPLPLLDVRGQLPAAVWQAAQAGDLVVGFPEFWQTALIGSGSGAGSARIAADVIGVSSTAPCTDSLAAALVSAGLARLLQIYGSSETGGVGWRDGAGLPYRLLPFWQRQAPADDHDHDPDHALLRTLADGSTRALRLQDRLRWTSDADEDGFLPAGRLDDAVQVGGVNVFPAALAGLLRQHPGVRDAAVRLMRPDEGERLKAFIVPVDDASEQSLTAQLVEWMRARVDAGARPASYTFGNALPRQRNGKLADWIIDAD